MKYFTLFLSFLVFSCNSVKEKNDYKIISVVLNHEFDPEYRHGLSAEDTSEIYQSVLIKDHNKLTDLDYKIIEDYLINVDNPDFSIEDFQTNQIWDIGKIKDFETYKLEVLEGQNIISPYIGVLQISSISYNKSLDKALVYTYFFCGAKCESGYIYRLVKENNGWRIENREVLLVS